MGKIFKKFWGDIIDACADMRKSGIAKKGFKKEIESLRKEANKHFKNVDEVGVAILGHDQFSRSELVLDKEGIERPKWGGVPFTPLLMRYTFFRMVHGEHKEDKNYRRLYNAFNRAFAVNGMEAEPPQQGWLQDFVDIEFRALEQR